MRRYSVFFDIDKTAEELLIKYSPEKFKEYEKINNKNATLIKEWLLTDTSTLNRLGKELVKQIKESTNEKS